MNKPREFWIYPDRYPEVYETEPFEGKWKDKYIHVIEKSVYDQLKAENEKLKREILEMVKTGTEMLLLAQNEILTKQNEELKSRAEKLERALKMKCMCWPDNDPRASRNPCHACKVLADWQKFIGDKNENT